MAYQITDTCIACGLCKDACPVEAISEGSPIFIIDQDKCIDCGACAGECPNEAITAVADYITIAAPFPGKRNEPARD